MSTLKEGTAGAGENRGRVRARGVLVTAQVALSLMLLVGAGLMAQAFAGLLKQDPGFDPGNTLTFHVPLTTTAYPDRFEDARPFHQRLQERLAALPGVTAVGASNALPLTQDTNQTGVRFPGAEGNTGEDEQDSPLIDLFRVTPGYFQAAGLRLMAGRSFELSDAGREVPVVIIDDVLARRFFPNGSALEQQMSFGGDTAIIVGVVDQARFYNVHSDDRGQVFRSFDDSPIWGMSYAVRTDLDPLSLASAARGVLREMDPAVPMSEVRTLDAIFDASLGQQRLSLTLLVSFALGALLLATLGIYGVVANSIVRRTREMGLRMALGADANQVLGMVLTQGLKLTVLGSAVGLVGAVWTSRLLEGVIVGLDPQGPMVYAGVAAALIGVAAMASYLPARRATRIDPVEALRPE